MMWFLVLNVLSNAWFMGVPVKCGPRLMNLTEEDYLTNNTWYWSEQFKFYLDAINNPKLEITGIPLVDDEEARDMVKEVGRHIGVTDFEGILTVTRDLSPGLEIVPRPLLALLDSLAYRDLWTHRASFYPNLTANQINPHYPNDPVDIVEYLSPFHRKLLNKATEFCRKNHYKHCWCKDGNIYIRKTDTSYLHRITRLNYFEEFDTKDYQY